MTGAPGRELIGPGVAGDRFDRPRSRLPGDAPGGGPGLIAALRRQAAQLERELARCRDLAAATERLGRTGTWDLEPAGGALTWSAGTYRIFGIAPGEPITLQRVRAFFPPEYSAKVTDAIAAAMAQGTSFDMLLPLTRDDGSSAWVRSIGNREIGTDGLAHLFGFVQDVTLEITTKERLRNLASCDVLTEVSNRRAFLDSLDAAMQSARAGAGLALVLLDIDHFKDVNDLHGHAAGDDLLREVARRLTAGVRPGDTVARLGGDEFALILPGIADEATVQRRLATILALFKSPVELATGPLDAGISLGASIYPTAGVSADAMLKSADIALYSAKSFGRGRACVFTAGLGEAAEARQGLLTEMRSGVARGQLEVFYQPIIDLQSGAVRGLEALVRWRHPTRGLLGPAAFMPALADQAVSVEIGNFVLASSLRQLRDWVRAGLPVTCVNVNVSDGQLRRGDELVDRILGLLGETGLTPDRLKIELLESAFLGRQAEALAQTLRRLQREGVLVALDDFGTGYASLTHIKQFDVRKLKIDRSFVAGVCDDPSDAAITRSIIDLGRNLGIRVTAEGVETAEQLAFLVAAGCGCAQGYLFARPMPAGDIAGFCADWFGGAGQRLLGRPCHPFAEMPLTPAGVAERARP